MKLNYNDIKFIINEAAAQLMEEGIGINQFPKYGYCLILAGQPGSGKSFLLQNQIPINGKIFSLDDYREKYGKLIGKKNPDRNKAKDLLLKAEKYFFNNQGDIKNNVIIDACGLPEKRGSWSIFQEIASIVKPLGYKLGVIWVATNRSVAMQRNINRARTLDNSAFHDRANKVNKFIPEFLSSSKANDIDDAWIVFNSGKNLYDDNIPKTISLEKTTEGFVVTDALRQQLNDFLGPQAKMVRRSPQNYLTNAEVKQLNYKPKDFLKQGNSINESLSSKLYHFTTINILSVMDSFNEILLSSVGDNNNDKELNSGFNFYLSFTRERTSQVGYAGYKNGAFNDIIAQREKEFGDEKNNEFREKPLSELLLVRLEFDGNLLNNSFKGKPVNYHYRHNKFNKLHKMFSPEELVVFRQSEDRLLSNKYKIENADKYIKRIDVLFPENEIFKTGKFNKTAKYLAYLLLNGTFKDKMNVFFNVNDYNSNMGNVNNDNEKFLSYFNNVQIDKRESKKLSNDMKKRLAAHLYWVSLETNLPYLDVIEFVLADYKKIVSNSFYQNDVQEIINYINIFEKQPPKKNEYKMDRFNTNFNQEMRTIYLRTMMLLNSTK